ncbi:MAG: hypothetical protein J6Z49_05705 [Kiritimatiellae bacterium]|nr:hypothetical protein [Kiritimatiellia bacterium]
MSPILQNFPKRESYDEYSDPNGFNHWMKRAVIIAALIGAVVLVVLLIVRGCSGKTPDAPTPQRGEKPQKTARAAPDLKNPVRPAVRSFGRNSSLPLGRESLNAGAIDLATFNPVNDLIHFEDPRVWFESDHDTDDETDNDHLLHRAMEWPLRRLVNLVEQKGGKLKIQDTYRSADTNKIHTERSLHCEGRAIDLTSENLSLSELANLCWQAGFDYVLYEAPKRSGEHIHTSVRREHDTLPFEQPGFSLQKQPSEKK